MKWRDGNLVAGHQMLYGTFSMGARRRRLIAAYTALDQERSQSSQHLLQSVQRIFSQSGVIVTISGSR
jgi:hypothetical protein